MAPDCGVMLSQLPHSMLSILIEYCMPTTDGDSANGEASDCAPPLFALSVMVAGLTSKEGAFRGVRLRRMRLLDESATSRLQEASSASPQGPFNRAWAAAPPSPENPGVPVPARVVRTPAGLTHRTWFNWFSLKQTLLLESTTTPSGRSKAAWVAGFPSSAGPRRVPPPATVVTFPWVSIRRMRLFLDGLLSTSVTNRFPWGSRKSPNAWVNRASRRAPSALPRVVEPANVETIPPGVI